MCVLHVACHLICVVHFDLSCQVRCNGAERFDGGNHDEGLEGAPC